MKIESNVLFTDANGENRVAAAVGAVLTPFSSITAEAVAAILTAVKALWENGILTGIMVGGVWEGLQAHRDAAPAYNAVTAVTATRHSMTLRTPGGCEIRFVPFGTKSCGGGVMVEADFGLGCGWNRRIAIFDAATGVEWLTSRSDNLVPEEEVDRLENRLTTTPMNTPTRGY